MNMSRISQTFQDLRDRGAKALMPFLTAGDPSLEFTAQAMKALADEGCSLLEIGFPYSDPIADGPVIQASYTRTLQRGIRLEQVFQMLEEVLPSLPIPVVAMVSYALVLRRGVPEFVAQAKRSGLAGLIVPDLPVDECEQLRGLCLMHGLDLIQLVAPTTPRRRALEIARQSSGFIYYVSVAGITGERQQLPQDMLDNVTWLRTQTRLPICVGFGISRPEHARLVASVADGVIVGSAFVRRIAEGAEKDPDLVLREIREFARSLLDAMPVGPGLGNVTEPSTGA